MSLRKSKRASAVAWKEGDTRALFQAPGHRAPEEIAAAKMEAAEERKSKERATKAKAKKTALDIQHAAQLEDALAKEREEAEDAFPRRCSGMLNDYLTSNVECLPAWQLDVDTEDDSEPDKESPTQKASIQITGPSKQTYAHHRAQPNHRQPETDIIASAKSVQGPTSNKYPFYVTFTDRKSVV